VAQQLVGVGRVARVERDADRRADVELGAVDLEEEQAAGVPVGVPPIVAVPLPLSVSAIPGGKALAPAVMVVPGPPLVTKDNCVERPCVRVTAPAGKTNCKPVVEGAAG